MVTLFIVDYAVKSIQDRQISQFNKRSLNVIIKVSDVIFIITFFYILPYKVYKEFIYFLYESEKYLSAGWSELLFFRVESGNAEDVRKSHVQRGCKNGN